MSFCRRSLTIAAGSVLLVSLAVTKSAAAGPTAEVMEIPGGTRALARVVGHVDPRSDRFAASLNRVLLRRIRNDHDWQRVEDRRLLSEYVGTVRELLRTFPGRTVLTLEDGGLPQAYLELAGFFGFEYRGGEWITTAASGSEGVAANRRQAALALDLNIRSLAYRLQRGETVAVDIPTDRVDAPMALSQWSALSGRAVTAENALTELIEDQRFGLLLEGLRRADAELPEILGTDGLRTIYQEGSLPFYRFSPALQLRDGALALPGGDASQPVWRKLVGARPEDTRLFLPELLREDDTRAAHLWHAMYFADTGTSRFLLAESRAASALRGPLLDYIDRILHAEGAGLLPSGRGGDHSVTTLLRSLPLDGGDRSRRGADRAAPWIERRGLQQACLEGPRLRKIVRKIKDRGATPGAFLEHLLGDATPLHGTLGLLFQPFIQIQDLYERDPDTLTPVNVLLLRRAAAYRPLVLEALLDLPFDQPEDLTGYLLTAEHLDCLEPGPGRDAMVLRFQGGVELLSAIMRAGTVPRAAVSRALTAWSALHRGASLDSALESEQLRWLQKTLLELPDPGSAAPGRGAAETRLLAALAGGFGTQSFRAYGLGYSGRRGRDLAAAMAAFLASQSIASVDLLVSLERHLEKLRDAARRREDLRMRLTVFQILALIEPLGVPPEARLAGLERPEFAESVRHRLELRQLIETQWRGQPAVGEGAIGRTIAAVRRLLARELEGALCSIAYLRPIALLGNSSFDQPLLVLRHSVARAVDPQSAAPDIFPSAWNETAVVPAAFSPAGSHLAGSLRHVPQALVRHHALGLAPEGRPHTWLNVGPWIAVALESGWQDVPPASFRLVGAALDAGDAVIAAATADRAGLPPELSAALDRIVPRRRFQQAAVEGAALPLCAPSERLQVGLLLLEPGAAPAALDGARRALTEAAARTGPDWRAALQPLGVPTRRLNGRQRAWFGDWPTYESLEREASVVALRERQLVDVWIAVMDYARRRDLPAHVGYDILLRVLEHIPEEVVLESERDWEGLVRFTAGLDGPKLDGRLRECLIRALYSVEPL